MAVGAQHMAVGVVHVGVMWLGPTALTQPTLPHTPPHSRLYSTVSSMHALEYQKCLLLTGLCCAVLHRAAAAAAAVPVAVCQVAREGFVVFFSEVFDAMFRLCADSETNVQNAVQFLDNLVKVGAGTGVRVGGGGRGSTS
jgi:hypothetical protein